MSTYSFMRGLVSMNTTNFLKDKTKLPLVIDRSKCLEMLLLSSFSLVEHLMKLSHSPVIFSIYNYFNGNIYFLPV